jgi:Gpi18-like mannosyltransferase
MKINKNLIFIFVLFVFWRIILFTTAYFSPQLIPGFGARFPYYEERLISSGLPHFLWSFGNFDGVHYLGIAKDAYAYQFTQAFFPLYPMMIRTLQYVVGNPIISALLISNLAFLAGLIMFHKLVSNFYTEKTAFWSVLFILFFPTSFYFGAIYTEGIFFLFVSSSFYLLNQKNFLLASVIGSLASATRIVGIFLAPALFVRAGKNILPLLVVPLGTIVYMIYLKIKFNQPFYFLTAQSIFGQERSTTNIVLLPQVVWRYIKIISTTEGLVLINSLYELAATVFALAALYIGFRKKLKTEWLVFAIFAVITPTLTGTFISMPRYILVAFPIYIVLAQIKNDLLKVCILIIFFLMLISGTVLFAQGYWVA